MNDIGRKIRGFCNDLLLGHIKDIFISWAIVSVPWGVSRFLATGADYVSVYYKVSNVFFGLWIANACLFGVAVVNRFIHKRR